MAWWFCVSVSHAVGCRFAPWLGHTKDHHKNGTNCLPVIHTGTSIGLVSFGLIHYSAFFGSEGHVALDRNPGTGYDTLLLQMIPGDLLSAFPHRQFHTLPGLLDSWAALPNSYPNIACHEGRQFVPFL